jgi:hypothetical protein
MVKTYEGTTVGSLKVLRRLEETTYLCKCSCGKEIEVTRLALKSGIKSCRTCYNSKKRKMMEEKKGPLWSIWKGIKQRCYSKGNRAYKNYGGRGIKMCDRWKKSFEAFCEDMGPRPEGYAIERIDNDGDYEPGNCRWATQKEQCRNKRTNRLVEYNGKLLPVSLVAELVGISPYVIYYRLNRNWPEDKLFRLCQERMPTETITYKGETAPIGSWAKKVGIHPEALRSRIRNGWTVEKALTKPYIPRSAKTITHNGKTASMKWWAKKTGLNYELIVSRLRSGWSVENALTVPANWKGRYVVLEVNGEKVYVPNSEVSDFIKKYPDAEFPS